MKDLKVDWDIVLFAMVILLGFGYIYGITFFKTCEASKDWVNVILGFILGPLMEENLRRAMLLSRGDALVFFQKPISASFLIVSIILLAIIALPNLRKKREEVFVAEV